MSAKTDEPQQRGWGWGAFEPGERVTAIAQLVPGRLYLEWNAQFDAKNIVQITRGDPTPLKRDLVHGRFVDPLDPSQGALGNDREFVLWGWELRQNEFYEARPKTKP